jgi:hypothetical protein
MRTMRTSLALLAGAASTAYAFSPSSMGAPSLRPLPLSRSAHRSCRGPACAPRRSAAPMQMMVDPSTVRLRARCVHARLRHPVHAVPSDSQVCAVALAPRL